MQENRTLKTLPAHTDGEEECMEVVATAVTDARRSFSVCFQNASKMFALHSDTPAGTGEEVKGLTAVILGFNQLSRSKRFQTD